MSYFPTNLNIPATKEYTHIFSRNLFAAPEPEELAEAARSVGSRIQILSAKGMFYLTPNQRKNFFEVCRVACLSLAAVALSFAYVALLSLPIYFTAVPLAVGSYYLFKWVKDYCNAQDFHSEKGRQKLANTLATLSLKELNEQYPVYEKIIGYQLLDPIAPSTESSPDQRFGFYAYFKILVKEHINLEEWHRTKIEKVNKIFRRETAQMQECWSDLKLAEWKAPYQESMDKWQEWAKTEKEAIDHVYAQSMALLESRYSQMKLFSRSKIEEVAPQCNPEEFEKIEESVSAEYSEASPPNNI